VSLRSDEDDVAIESQLDAAMARVSGVLMHHLADKLSSTNLVRAGQVVLRLGIPLNNALNQRNYPSHVREEAGGQVAQVKTPIESSSEGCEAANRVLAIAEQSSILLALQVLIEDGIDKGKGTTQSPRRAGGNIRQLRLFNSLRITWIALNGTACCRS